MPHQLEPLYARLRQVGVTNPTSSDDVFKLLTCGVTNAQHWGYRERRKELLLALLDDHADDFDSAVEDLGRIIDRLRQIGIRGFVAENTDDRDFARVDQPRPAEKTASGDAERQAGKPARDSTRRPATTPAPAGSVNKTARRGTAPRGKGKGVH
jgi:hypothetical protein